MFISSAFAQTAPAAEAGANAAAASPFSGLLDALAKGDEVATAGGLLGRIVQLGDSHLTLEVADGVQVQVQRHAVVQVLPKGSLK